MKETQTKSKQSLMPAIIFSISLFFIIFIIIIGSIYRKPKDEIVKNEKKPPEVSIYSLDGVPRVQTQAVIEKDGIAKIYAQTSGVIQSVNRKEGEHLQQGEQLLNIVTNYYGNSLDSLNLEIAQKKFDLAEATYGLSKDSIGKRREQLDRVEENSREALERLKDVINNTQTDFDNMSYNISTQENSLNKLSSNDPARATISASINQLKSSRTQLLSGLNTLKNSLRQIEYSNDGDSKRTVSTLSKETSKLALEMEEKNLDMNKDLAKLSLSMAQISQNMNRPTTPICGIVDRVFVKTGQTVRAGDLLATVAGDIMTAQAVAMVSYDIARKIDTTSNAYISLDGQTVPISILYVSKEPVENMLHSVIFSFPEGFVNDIVNGKNIDIDLPISDKTNLANVFVPLDAIYQTQDSAYLYVIRNFENVKKAKSKKIKLGKIYGNYVEVISGLDSGDNVILNRNIIEDEVIEVVKK